MKNKISKGFTLIELLIVIALLGALAVGLLAALDPFEQLKKGTDTGIRNTVSEIHGSLIRYYAIKSTLPWGEGAYSGTAEEGGDFSSYLQSVIDTGELKADFFKLAGSQLQQIYVNATADTATVCFQPKSKSFRSDPNTKYSSDGSDLGDTTNCPTSNSCYWCVR
jgi:prepilin-type N-terminal cleavage/methylation domain-containing protein